MRNSSSLRHDYVSYGYYYRTLQESYQRRDKLLTQSSGAEELFAGGSPTTKEGKKKKFNPIFSFKPSPDNNNGRSAPSSFDPPFYSQSDRKSRFDFDSVTMAPKSKKSGDNINSRLALVMKSGKGEIGFKDICEHRVRS